MHSTWQTGDPVVQLDFPNPLNVSVQLGDIAYFSNPTPVGIDGIPKLLPYITPIPPPPTPSGVPWTSTTTPHLTNEQNHIIMIGEIIQIIPWSGTVSSIICNMPQALFNQYFAQIQACVTTITITPGITTTTGGDAFDTCPCANEVNIPCPEFNTGDPNLPFPYNRINAFANVIKEGLLTPNNNIDFKFLATVAIPTQSWYVDPCRSQLFSGKTEHKINKLRGIDGIELRNVNELINYLNTVYAAGLSTAPTYIEIETAMLASGNFADFPAMGSGGSPSIFTIIDWVAVCVKQMCQCGTTPVVTTTTPETTTTDTVCPDDRSFIMFSKDNKVNMSSILGYYASVEFKNSSKVKSEIFNVGTSFFESSK